MKAHVDQDTCIGCGLCPQICSEVFELNDDGKAYAKVEKVPSDMENAATEAQESCPVAAIRPALANNIHTARSTVILFIFFTASF